ncbi:gliding motility-associated C-terminal domain-containing protein [Flavobacterium sp. N1736]|uniref:gliding motility-associated C-terminal domain-containing protein n=1 Tax=Flavobacterium sp. N1736 TaxID=2986823 RepID=UPI00222567D5|nr:gliding motility-associated C-terminal domain-containing protein [Flavobacterium sp. N1736]
MKKNDSYKVINKLRPVLSRGKSSGGMFSCLMILLICQTGHAQFNNEGEIRVKAGTEMYIYEDYENEESGVFINDGQVSIFKNWLNKGIVGFDPDYKGTTFFRDKDSSKVFKPQLINGDGLSEFQNLVFDNSIDKKQMPFLLQTNINAAGMVSFKNGVINALHEDALVIFGENALHENAGNQSFVDGKVAKKGNARFEFPVGDGNEEKLFFYRPNIADSSLGENTYISQYFLRKTNNEFLPADKKDVAVLKVNNAEYWQVTQESGPDKIILGLTLNDATTPNDFSNLNADEQLAIVRWDGEKWVSEGGIAENISGTNYSNLIMGEVTGYGFFTIGIVKKSIEPRKDEIIVYNAISPNGDGLNDTFHIAGINSYPDNTVEIYNRWGVKVYDTKGYNESDNMFTGYSDGRATIKRGEKLPTGTYFYILRYNKDGNGMEKSGYLYVNNQ